MKRKPLYFPTNCPDANDITRGFGQKELWITALSMAAAVVAAVIIYLNSGSMVFAVGTAGFITAMTVIAVKRDMHQESIVMQIRQIIRYHKAQKKFLYEYYNIYEGEAGGQTN